MTKKAEPPRAAKCLIARPDPQFRLLIGYSIKGHDVVIFERRPKWDNPKEWMESPVAKIKFIRSADKWRLYWQRADLKWHEYPGLSSSDRINDLVQEIDADPLACFFG
jgi:hypothetical protein